MNRTAPIPLAHPAFLLSVVLLLANDWLLKPVYPNALTGKLSDFAGLFAFPYLLATLWPRQRLLLHMFTVGCFILWKSSVSQPLIDALQYLGLPLHRTVDATDNLALLAVWASWKLLQKPAVYRMEPFLRKTAVVISSLAFMATSLPPRDRRVYTTVDKSYTFPYSRRELVSRLNRVQLEEVEKMNKRSPGSVNFHAGDNTFRLHSNNDTIACILDYRQLKNTDTIFVRTSFAQIQLQGSDSTSKLTLMTIATPLYKRYKEGEREKLIKQFERRIIHSLSAN